MNLCYFLFEPQSSQESEATSCVLSSRHLQIGFTVLNLYLSKEKLALTGCFDHTCSGVWGCWSLLARTSRKAWTWRSSAYFHSRQGPQLDIFIPVSPILIIRCLDKVPIRVQGGGTSQPTRSSHAGQGTDLGRFFNSLATRRNSIVTMNSLCLLVFVKSHQKHHIIYYTPFFLLIIVAPFFSSNLYLRQISKIFNSIFIFFFRTTCFDLLALLVGFPIC